MRLKVYNFLLFVSLLALLSHAASAQYITKYRVYGQVREAVTGRAIPECEVQVMGQSEITQTDSTGVFYLTLPPGPQRLRLISINHPSLETEIVVSLSTTSFSFSLGTRRDRTLDEVKVLAQQSTFGQTRLREVEGTAIFAAKKSEVIVLDKLVANLATNNARQIYARVPGLNIWESDGGGLQLSIGGRGLDPNRTGSFNTRQNGYDISADALGYPESYYTPPTEAVQRIQLVRGAASLQYGSQFGGLLNFQMRAPTEDRKAAVTLRQTVGSFGFYNTSNSVSGTVDKLSYYTFAQYKRADGWRPNSHFDSKTFYADVRYQARENLKIGLQYTHMDYLAQQPGGLDDAQFAQNPRQSNRERNWFGVDWNLFNVNADWKISPRSNINVLAFGLVARRQSLGYRPVQVSRTDDDTNGRDLIDGTFRNYGLEARYLTRYQVDGRDAVLLLGTRYYNGFNHSRQGFGPTGRGADFTFVEPSRNSNSSSSDYRFPNHNLAFFTENIFYLSPQLSLTPGVRYEYISTQANGTFEDINRDLPGNIIGIQSREEARQSKRSFVIAGVGLSYKPREAVELYTNISQNYRSITFSDMQIVNSSFLIDPNLQDEKGFSADLGLRGDSQGLLTYDVSVFALNYGNRIGEVQTYSAANNVLRRRTNVGRALILGVETYAEVELTRLGQPTATPDPGQLQWSVFTNLSLIRGRYVQSDLVGVQGNPVEFVPAVNLKTGTRTGYGPFKGSLQFSYLSDQFTDATKADEGGTSAVVGLIPAYHLLDFSVSWEHRWLKLEGSLNNLTNEYYFTRRAIAYPGPGIIPSDGRAFFLTAQVKI